MLGGECDFKMHVQNLGYPIPLQKSHMSTTSQLKGKFTAYIFRMKHDIDNHASALKTRRGLLHCPKTTWTLVHKRLQIGPPCLSTLRKFCVLLHCQASQTDISKRNSTKLLLNGEQSIALTICRRKVGVVLPEKMGAKLLHLFGFRRLRDLSANGEYLLNETW